MEGKGHTGIENELADQLANQGMTIYIHINKMKYQLPYYACLCLVVMMMKIKNIKKGFTVGLRWHFHNEKTEHFHTAYYKVEKKQN